MQPLESLSLDDQHAFFDALRASLTPQYHTPPQLTELNVLLAWIKETSGRIVNSGEQNLKSAVVDVLQHVLPIVAPSTKEDAPHALPSDIFATWFGCIAWLYVIRAQTHVLAPGLDTPALMAFTAHPSHSQALSSSTDRCLAMWDALVEPLQAASTKLLPPHGPSVVNELVVLFVTHLRALMEPQPVAFFVTCLPAAVLHIRCSMTTVGDVTVRSLVDHVERVTNTKHLNGDVTVICMASMLLAAAADKDDKARAMLERLQRTAVELLAETSSELDMSNPLCGIATALGACVVAGDQLSAEAPALHAWALLRASVSVPRVLRFQALSAHTKMTSQLLISSRAVLTPMHVRVVVAALELAAHELMDVYATSAALTLHSWQSILPEDTFRGPTLLWLETSSDDFKTSENEAQMKRLCAYWREAYEKVVDVCHWLTLRASDRHSTMLPVFAVLNSLEFIRVTGRFTPDSKTAVDAVTQGIERMLEDTPEVVAATLLRQALNSNTMAASEASASLNLPAAYAHLNVGLLLQRHLRTVLFQCTPFVHDQLLTLVFEGVGCHVAALDAFSHRFLGFALANLNSIVPATQIIPTYLETVLLQFPDNASQSDVAMAFGTVCGTLLYATPTWRTSERNAFLLWAIRKGLRRVRDLLAMRSTRSSESSSDDADSAAETAAAALYLLEVATEVIKLVPLSLLQPCAIELESLVASLTSDQRMQHQVQCKLFDCISQNCDSEKRAWLAAWLIELNNAYPTQPSPPVSIEQLCDHPSQRQLSKL